MNKEGDQAAVAVPEIDEREEKQIEARIAVSAPVVHEAIRHEGERELERSLSALAWSGLAAGFSMGFSLVAEGLLRSRLPDQPWRPLISKMGYPLGFILVIIGRQQLFTENTLTVILPLLANRNLSTLLRVARLWAVVLVSNIAGAHVIAWVLSNTAVFRGGASCHARHRARIGSGWIRRRFTAWHLRRLVDRNGSVALSGADSRGSPSSPFQLTSWALPA